MEILRCENVKKIYGTGDNQVAALDGVNLSVEKGEFVAIMGASGSGKTTLLNCISILMPLLLDKKEPDKEYFSQIIKSLGIENKLDLLPDQLSGGQQQRVAIARSLVYRPALLLADEPTGSLDRENGREVVDMLKLSSLNFGQTIIIITHDEKVALEAERIVTIEDGHIISDQKNGKGRD